MDNIHIMFFQSLAEFPYFLIGEKSWSVSHHITHVAGWINQGQHGKAMRGWTGFCKASTFGGCLKTTKKVFRFIIFPCFHKNFQQKPSPETMLDHVAPHVPWLFSHFLCSLHIILFICLDTLVSMAANLGVHHPISDKHPNIILLVIYPIKYPQCHGRSLYNLQFKPPWFNH